MKRLLLTLCGVVLLSGCEFTGINSYPLPFTEGSDGFVVTVEMANSVNLVANSEVKVDDITVGSVRSIEFADWHAALEVALEDSVHLPKNAIARIGQKSLLGAEYLELVPPPKNPSPEMLADGDRIGLERTGRYPETEEVLSALSLLLNGGGLDQIKTISTELNKALRGRTGDYRSLLKRLNTFVGSLDAQRGEIVRAMAALDKLAGRLAGEKEVLADAIDTIPGGLKVLNNERRELTTALRDLASFGRQAVRTVNASRADLLRNLRSLQPSLDRLADAGSDLPESLGLVLFPLATDKISETFRGDYGNLFITADLSAHTINRNFLSGGPLDGVLAGILGPPSGESPGPDDPPVVVPDTKPSPKTGAQLPSLPAQPRDGASTGLAGLLNPMLGGDGS